MGPPMSNKASRRYRRHLRALRRTYRPTVLDRAVLWACGFLPFTKRPLFYHEVAIHDDEDDNAATRPIYASLNRRELWAPERISQERINKIATLANAELRRVEMFVGALRFAKADAETW